MNQAISASPKPAAKAVSTCAWLALTMVTLLASAAAILDAL
jgi:hypothetical protein